MASSPSNKLSSPIISRGNPNPVSRNSETVNPIRRSSAGNPFVKPSIISNPRGLIPKTPANSPLDYPQRYSTGNRDSDEKENGKDNNNPKSGRIRSPTIGNCSKNFMSPTISASSKIAMASKKKILVERNETVRSSLSSLNSVDPSEAIQPNDLNHDCHSTEASSDLMELQPALRASSSIPKPSKNVTFIDCVTKSSGSLPDTMFEEADLVNLDNGFSTSPTSSCPSSCRILAPLDEGPSMVPYDPKTNYLSPRPQFLHYRPNRRFERYLQEEETGKGHEGSFLFGSFSDTEGTDETQSESSQKSEEVSQKSEEDEEEEENQNVSEQCLISNNSSDENNRQPRFRNIYKLTALILLLCFACSSVLYTIPMVNRIAYEESSFFLIKNTNPYEIYQFAKSNYHELAENFKVWFKKVADIVHGVSFNFREENQLGKVKYFNLTALQEDISVDGYFVLYQTREQIDDSLPKPLKEIIVDSELLEEDAVEYSAIMEAQELSYEEEEHQDSERHESLEELPLVETNIILEENDEKKDNDDDASETSYEEEEHQMSERHESLEELSGENDALESEMDALSTLNTPSSETSYEEEERHESLEELSEENDAPESKLVETNIIVEENGEKLSNADASESSVSLEMSKKVMSLILLLPSLMAAAIFFYSRRVKTRSSNTKESKNQGLSSLEDMVGESYPSELSSTYRNGGGSNETQSQEMKPRKNNIRESSSSSSFDSPSYGSFTAYEKIPTKHGHMEEEMMMMTPVRRSSRIKSKLHD